MPCWDAHCERNKMFILCCTLYQYFTEQCACSAPTAVSPVHLHFYIYERIKCSSLASVLTLVHIACCQWRSQKVCVRGADPSVGRATVEAPKTRNRVGSTRVSGGASWAPPLGSGAKHRPETHFLHILSHRSPIESKIHFQLKFISMSCWSNNNFYRCPVLRGQLPWRPPLATPMLAGWQKQKNCKLDLKIGLRGYTCDFCERL